MHPSGVQFGLSRGLVHLRGEEVLLSDALLEAVSIEAQLYVHLGKPPIEGNFLVEITVRAAQKALQQEQTARRQEVVPFFAGLNRVMYFTLSRVAERAAIARKEPKRLVTEPEFWNEFSVAAAGIRIKQGKTIAQIQKLLFEKCRELVRARYEKNDPENIRHTDLVALFIFNFWNATGLLPMTQALVILSSTVEE
jgi:hypothetical protein